MSTALLIVIIAVAVVVAIAVIAALMRQGDRHKLADEQEAALRDDA